MAHRKNLPEGNLQFLRVDTNRDAVLKLLRSYYRSHTNTGGMAGSFPDFFLVRPEVLKDADLVSRASDRMILDDCVQRASARGGYVGISKWRNPKLNYYWLELSVFPYMLGDEVTQNNQGEFFQVLSHFIEYTRQNPKPYGNLTAEIDSDKDLALMLAEIKRRGEKIQALLSHYALDMLVRFNPSWPVGEVNKLLLALKGSDQSWCEVFFEHVIYVMSSKRSQGG